MTLSTLSKSDHILFQAIVQFYLKVANYLQFKAQRKLFLTQKHEDNRLRWACKHID